MSNIIKHFTINNSKEAVEILKSAGNEELFEKAKWQVGDIHPQHPNWIWTEYAPGKFDWRHANGKYHNLQSKLKNADDDILKKIISGEIQGGDKDKQIAKKILESRQKGDSAQSATQPKTTSKKIDTNKKQDNLIGPNKIKKGDKIFDIESNIIATVDSYDESKKKYYVTMKDDTGNFSWYVSADKLKDIKTVKEETQKSAKREVKKLMEEEKSKIERMASVLSRAVDFRHESFSHIMRLDRGIICRMHFEARTSTTKTIDDKVKSREYEYLATAFNLGDKYKNNVLYKGNKPLKEEELKSLIEKFAEETANKAVKEWWGW